MYVIKDQIVLVLQEEIMIWLHEVKKKSNADHSWSQNQLAKCQI